ncbi:hypothetical protein [Massilia sp. CCM 8734]|uniref:hypothetical protein n=1 Tax=Massilia sp. CCM 8734 TaxID=2609283 RepID=UPI00141EA88D|nr:hypothetical protein [Massilia sp. CCM 8734]NHZ98740.1 hypothetical protein [Massilia sp. CCM 8734]
MPVFNRNAIVLLAALLVGLPASAHGACAPGSDTILNYRGQIDDKYKVAISLKFAGKSVTGDYYYASQRKNIALRGTVDGHLMIELEELDQKGEVSASFDLSGNAGCQTLLGTWRKRGAAGGMRVYVELENETSGELSHRYRIAGAENDERIHQGATRFWQAVKDGNRQLVAGSVHYPVSVRIKGRKTTLRSPADLLANYDAVFSKAYREAILNAVPHNMFANYKGIMLGSGHVWFNAEGDVMALNN